MALIKTWFEDFFWIFKNGFCSAGGNFAQKKFCKTRSSSNMSKNAQLSASGWNPKLHNYHPSLQEKALGASSVTVKLRRRLVASSSIAGTSRVLGAGWPSGGDIGPAGGGQVLPCPAPAALCRHPTCPLHPAQHQPCYQYLTFSVALSNAVFLTLAKCHHSASVGIFRQKPDLLTFVMHAWNYPNGPQLSSSVQVQVGGGGKLENKSHFGRCLDVVIGLCW